MPPFRRLRSPSPPPPRRPAAPLRLGALLLVVAPALLTGCLDAPDRPLPGLVCRNLAPDAPADTLTLHLRAEPPDEGAGRLLVRVDPAGEGPGPETREVTAGLALDSRGIFRGCAGASSELLLVVPDHPVEKAWLWIGSDRPVRVVAATAGETPEGRDPEEAADASSIVVAPGASGTLRWPGP